MLPEWVKMKPDRREKKVRYRENIKPVRETRTQKDREEAAEAELGSQEMSRG